MINSGILEFNENQKVYIALDEQTGNVETAVKIDKNGNKTPIGGGGVNFKFATVNVNVDYTGEVALKENGSTLGAILIHESDTDSDYSSAGRIVEGSYTVIIPITPGGFNLGLLAFHEDITNIATDIVQISGDAEIVVDGFEIQLKIFGDCSITIKINLPK